MLAENQDKLITMLKRHPGATAKELAPRLQWTQSATSQRLIDLNDYGMVRRVRADPDSKSSGARVEYRYWFNPPAPIRDRLTELENAE